VLNRLGYWLRETFASLRRNLTLTMAAVLTAAVSLLLLGVALLARQGVGNQLVQWKGGVQFIVFMKADASEDQIQSVRAALAESPQVDDAKTVYLDKPAAFQEFQRIFRDQKTIAESLTVNDIPPNFKVVPRTDDSDIIQAVGNQLLTKPGVIEVRFARDYVDRLQALSRMVGVVSIAMFVVLLFTAVVLIWNTIRTAMFARRREIEVMKLVGATNWFIRIPFMLEGLLHGLAGGLLAVGGLYGVNYLWKERVIPKIPDLAALQVSSTQFNLVVVLVLVVGMLVGAIGSAVAASRFLDV
jgi:cell division transport system permease protein